MDRDVIFGLALVVALGIVLFLVWQQTRQVSKLTEKLADLKRDTASMDKIETAMLKVIPVDLVPQIMAGMQFAASVTPGQDNKAFIEALKDVFGMVTDGKPNVVVEKADG